MPRKRETEAPYPPKVDQVGTPILSDVGQPTSEHVKYFEGPFRVACRSNKAHI